RGRRGGGGRVRAVLTGGGGAGGRPLGAWAGAAGGDSAGGRSPGRRWPRGQRGTRGCPAKRGPWGGRERRAPARGKQARRGKTCFYFKPRATCGFRPRNWSSYFRSHAPQTASSLSCSFGKRRCWGPSGRSPSATGT